MSEDTQALIEHSRIPQRVSIHCTPPNGCGTLSRIYRCEPTTEIGALRFCPVCGNKVLALSSSEESGWEALAVAYGMSVPAIKLVHSAWNPNEFYRFSDYVTAMREEARTGRQQPARPMPHQTLTTTYAPEPITHSTLPRMKVPT